MFTSESAVREIWALLGEWSWRGGGGRGGGGGGVGQCYVGISIIIIDPAQLQNLGRTCPNFTWRLH